MPNMNPPTGRKTSVMVMTREICASVLWNSRAMAVRQNVTRKKSNASRSQPEKPAITAGGCPAGAAAWFGPISLSDMQPHLGGAQIVHATRTTEGKGMAAGKPLPEAPALNRLRTTQATHERHSPSNVAVRLRLYTYDQGCRADGLFVRFVFLFHRYLAGPSQKKQQGGPGSPRDANVRRAQARKEKGDQRCTCLTSGPVHGNSTRSRPLSPRSPYS